MSAEPDFAFAQHAVARLSALPASIAAPRLPRTLGSDVELRGFLADVAGHPHVSEAIEVSSEALAKAVAKAVAPAGDVTPKRLVQTALSAARYVSRMTDRPTPFGLLAGVAGVRFDDDAVKARFGTAHRKRVGPDKQWLTAVIRPWERDLEVLPRLRLVANDLCHVRDDRLVLPFVSSESDSSALDDRERTVRHTKVVRAVLAAARTPRSFADLTELLSAEFPAAAPSAVHGVIANLVELDILLTDLRPPVGVDDPLRYVLDVLSALPGHGGRAALAEIADALDAYEAAPVGSGAVQWRAATAAMRRLHVHERLIQVDLAVDADIVLPSAVPTELAHAATAAWRMAPSGLAPIDRLSDYRAEFLDRYGSDALVPLKELLDPHRGLGAPSGYLLPPAPGRPGNGSHRVPDPRRDHILFTLAHQAQARGEREVVVDDGLVAELARPDAEQGPKEPVEVCAQVLANSEDDLRAGDFRLVWSPMSYTLPGAMTGRFLRLLPDLRPGVARCAAERNPDEVPAQLVTALARSRFGNVAQVPRLTERTISVGVFADRSDPNSLGVDDIGIGADSGRFHVVSLRTGEELVPTLFHGLNTMTTMPNVARLLADIGESRTPAWPCWNWGSAEQLPYLPRVRHGRTVLAAARWTLDPRLRTGGLEWARWTELFHRWRTTWNVPDVVHAALNDHRLRVELDTEVGLRLLYGDLRKRPDMVIQEVPLGGEYGSGWTQDHAAEIVVPLRPLHVTRKATPRWSHAAVASATDTDTRRLHPPGGEWLSVKVYAEESVHADLLNRHVPVLVEAVAAVADRWFFLRYRDDRSHLRVRFHCDPAELGTHALGTIGDWATELAASGTIREVVVDTYRPEIMRYGGPEAIESAERAFCADSLSALEQLALRSAGKLDLPLNLLVAANHLDLLALLSGGDDWRDWFLDRFPKGPFHRAFRTHRQEAMTLLDPEGGWPALADRDGGPELIACWRRRAPLVADYGRVVRNLVARGTLDSTTTAFASILHLHHNRLAGINPITEQGSYAIARAVVQARRDKERRLDQ